MKKFGYKKLAVFALALVLLISVLYGGLQLLESTVLRPEEDLQETTPRKTITVEEKKYFPRQDITTLLVMGIDKTGPAEASGYHRNDGDADLVLLLILDEARQTYNALYLNRDSMVEMPVLGLLGDQAGTFYGQLALAHTYGSGLKDSCENTRNTVSQLLGGVNIDYYVSMRMDAIAMVNDAVGGVTVEVTEDFSQVDPTLKKGTVTLMGDQALHYVQTRKNVGDQLNLSRIERQKDYMAGFLTAFQKKKAEDPNFLLKTYDTVSPYLVSDCSIQVISGLLDRCSSYTLGQIVSPQGENVMGGEYYEFHIDEENLTQLALELFYSEK